MNYYFQWALVLTLVGYGGALIRAEEIDLQLPPNPPYWTVSANLVL